MSSSLLTYSNSKIKKEEEKEEEKKRNLLNIDKKK